MSTPLPVKNGLEAIENDPKLKEAWSKVLEVEQQLESIEEQMLEESAKLAAKYEKIKAPVYEKRKEVITSIPKFWATALSNHPILGSLLEEDDLEVLNHLVDITIEREEESANSHKLIMTFSENPFFTNTQLIKEFTVDKDSAQVKNHPIEWKEGKNLTHNGDSELDSFFNWFNEEGAELGELIANELYPNAFSYYQGGDSDEEDMGEMESEDDEDDEQNDEKPPQKKQKV
ncbi:NAP-domain-containing protein [Basidiobolus meristosporus CBS 931.73]|uniref:NAP-domain-containing protein n=1 Tax=Basidiobolus meristosporus CBS 931.73 TaxID=1314790 RepID=A0A1Y1Z949_9FUNG|nr:NAP-domain-containing protein [Basidiobolus meristosporus CBS 931.73]|eukprot:ORY06335.1 NAP-domain-containing protein [Basidiobolus meristosporus CBS 931.73]